MPKSVEVQSPINIFNLIISSLLSSNFLGCLFVFFTFVYIYWTESFSGNAGMAFNCRNDSLRIINSKIFASLFLVICWWIFCDFLGRFFPLNVHVYTHAHRDSHTFANADTSLLELLSSGAAHLTCTINSFCYVSPLFVSKSKTELLRFVGPILQGFVCTINALKLPAQSRHTQTTCQERSVLCANSCSCSGSIWETAGWPGSNQAFF